MKHLFLDTNEYIVCALLTEPDHTPETLGNIEEILDSGKTTLLVPELVKIEFSRVLADTLISIEKGVEDLKKKIAESYPQTIKRDKNDFLKAADDLFKKRRASSINAKAKINRLFSHPNTNQIKLTPDIFLNAYKRALSGRKPHDNKMCSGCCEATHVINNDCIIFESLISELSCKDIKDLIVCTANIKDYASYDKKNDKHVLHEDLSSDIPKGITIKYYRYISEAMKTEFRTAIPKKEQNSMVDIHKYLDMSQEFNRYRHAAKAFQEETIKWNELLKPSIEQLNSFNLEGSKMASMFGIINSIFSQKNKKEGSDDKKDEEKDKDKE